MAGEEGFEPPLAVLETAGLPLNLFPYPVDQHSSLLYCGVLLQMGPIKPVAGRNAPHPAT